MSGNYKWHDKIVDKNLSFVVVLFISRNKDNSNLTGFKERKRSYFRTYNIDTILRDFNHFVEDGLDGELCRLYISLNTRDPLKVKKYLLHELIDNDNFDFQHLEAKVAGIAAKKECALEKKWFFDFDSTDTQLIQDFLGDLKKYYTDIVKVYESPHGNHIVVEHGFDCRELMDKWKDIVTLKRDDMICFNWKQK